MISQDPLTPAGNRPMVTPIVTAINYEYGSFEILEQISSGKIKGFTYHRDDNPTVMAVEKALAAIEEGEHCLLATTGMSAISMVFFTYLNPGDQLIIFHDVYGANYKLSLILERFGVEVAWLDAADQGKVADIISSKTKMIFCETPTNPLCKTMDLDYLHREADKAEAIFVVDNTFATPWHTKPLNFGADIVVHSATKALGGHSDLMGGVIVTRDKQIHEDLWFTRQAIGTTLDPFPANLLDRGLKTLDVRAAKMAENGQAIAEFLADHKKIKRIIYPGLPTDPGHEIAKKQMKNGFGGMMAFDVGDSQEDAKDFITRLKKIYHAVSLGCTETLVCIPVLSTMLYLPEERRLSFGVNANTVRISAGIEATDLLLADLKQALE